MSGGTFEYKQHSIENIAYAIMHMLKEKCDDPDYCDHNHDSPVGEKGKAYMKLTAELLMHTYQLVHDLDWWLAGDTDEDDFIKAFEVQIQTIWSVASQGIMFGKIQGNPFEVG